MQNSIIPIDQVIADSRCQSRTGIDLELVREYADAIKSGADLPPLSTIQTDAGYYLYDGFHRIEAYRQAGKKQVAVASDPGDVWDAIERSCAVNAIHGKRRTPADTKNAVKKMLEVMRHRGVKWSQVEIAERCAITQQRVSQIINNEPSYKDLYDGEAPPTVVTRNGSTYEMNTSNIGKRQEWSTPDIRSQVDEAIDADTGEILDLEPPPYEEVDPTDPASFMAPMSATHYMTCPHCGGTGRIKEAQS